MVEIRFNLKNKTRKTLLYRTMSRAVEEYNRIIDEYNLCKEKHYKILNLKRFNINIELDMKDIKNIEMKF